MSEQRKGPPCQHVSGGSWGAPALLCKHRGVKRVKMGTFYGITNPIVCSTHAAFWETRGYVVESFHRDRWCDGCCREIDPTTCHCGDSAQSAEHRSASMFTHNFTPMGCACNYVQEVSE